MRIWLSLSLMLFFLVGSSQDTLYYKNGEMRIGHLLSIDSVGQRLALKNTSNMIQVIQFNVIQRIGQDQVALMQPDYFEAYQFLEDRYMEDTLSRQVYYFYKWESPFELGKYMISINLVSLFVKDGLTFPFNPSFMVGFEYLLNDKFGVSLFYRGGFGLEVIPRDTTREDNYSYPGFLDKSNELKYKIGIAPKWYIHGQTKNALFISPYVGFGSYYYYEVDNFSRYNEVEEFYYQTKYLIRRYEEGFAEFGVSTGVVFNVIEHLAGIVQIYGIWTDTVKHYQNYFEYDYTRESMVLRGGYIHDPSTKFQLRIQFLLAYRF